MSGLNDYLTAKREALRAQKLKAQKAGYPPNKYGAKVTTDDRTGVQRIQIGDFHFLSDSLPKSGGFRLGPTPVELLFASLGACIVSTFVSQAATRDVPVDSIEIDVDGQTDPRGNLPNYPDVPDFPHNVTFELRVTSPAPHDVIEELFAAAERLCTVTNLFTKSQEVHGRLVHTGSKELVGSSAS